jgi:hypothetical protein
MDSTVCAKVLFLLSFLFARLASIQKKNRVYTAKGTSFGVP